MKGTFRLFIIFLITFPLNFCFAQELPPNFYDEKIADDWDRPVGITFDESGQGYIWEKRGRVYILDKDGHKRSTPLVQIDEEVMNVGDHGLLGFALHPQFAENGYFYLLYVVDPHHLYYFGTPDYDPTITAEHEATIGRITRYTADPATGFTTIIQGSREVILGDRKDNGMPVLINSHGVGSLVFGTDGTLLASCGDAGSYESLDTGNAPSSESTWEQGVAEGIIRTEDNVGAFKSQQIDNLNGTVIRIDPETGEGLPSNPFFDATNPDAPRSKVWVLGFRNPYRFMHVPNTGSHNPEDGDPGTLIIGDVGGAGWEEMNIARTGGLNFGWPIFEGIEHHWGFFGAWTANPYMPNEPQDCNRPFYNFQDLIKQPNSKSPPNFTVPCGGSTDIPSYISTFTHTPPSITWSGLLWNQPPRTQHPSFNEVSGDLESAFVGTAESSVEGTGFAGFTSIPGFFYEDGPFPEEYHGAYFHADLSGWIRAFHFEDDFKLMQIDSFAIWDDKGVVHIAYNPHDGAIYWCNVYDSEVHRITYGGNPRPESIPDADRFFGPGPLTVQLDGSQAFDPDGGTITYNWDFGDGATSIDMSPTHTFIAASSAPQSFEVSLTVTDTAGLSDTETILISVNNTPPNVEITSFENGSTYAINGLTYLPLEAAVSDLEHKDEELNYKWERFLHHNNHYHPEEPVFTRTSHATIDPLGCQLETYWYRIRLTVTDAHGLASFDEHEIFPYCGDPFVELLELTGSLVGDEAVLEWTTIAEMDVQYFEIERTTDYRFQSIGIVEASPGTLGQDYRFNDLNPLVDGGYYRLKVFNSTGDYVFSNIIFIDYSIVSDYTIFPNPSSGTFKLTINEPRGEEVIIELVNTIGQPMYKSKWQTNPGDIFRARLELDQFPAGLYYYKLRHGDVEQTGSLLLVR